MEQIGLAKGEGKGKRNAYSTTVERAMKSELPFRIEVQPLASTEFVKTYNEHLYKLLTRWSWQATQSARSHPLYHCRSNERSKSPRPPFLYYTTKGFETQGRKYIWDLFTKTLNLQKGVLSK